LLQNDVKLEMFIIHVLPLSCYISSFTR